VSAILSDFNQIYPTLLKISIIKFHYHPRIGIELLHPSKWTDTRDYSSFSHFCKNGL